MHTEFVGRDQETRPLFDMLKQGTGIPPKKRTRDFMRLSPVVQIVSAS